MGSFSWAGVACALSIVAAGTLVSPMPAVADAVDVAVSCSTKIPPWLYRYQWDASTGDALTVRSSGCVELEVFTTLVTEDEPQPVPTGDGVSFVSSTRDEVGGVSFLPSRVAKYTLKDGAIVPTPAEPGVRFAQLGFFPEQGAERDDPRVSIGVDVAGVPETLGAQQTRLPLFCGTRPPYFAAGGHEWLKPSRHPSLRQAPRVGSTLTPALARFAIPEGRWAGREMAWYREVRPGLLRLAYQGFSIRVKPADRGHRLLFVQGEYRYRSNPSVTSDASVDAYGRACAWSLMTR